MGGEAEIGPPIVEGISVYMVNEKAGWRVQDFLVH